MAMINFVLIITMFLLLIDVTQYKSLCTIWLPGKILPALWGTSAKTLIFLVVLVWFVVGGFFIWKLKYTELWILRKKIPLITWYKILIVLLVGTLLCFFDVNILGNTEDYGAFKSCLLFDQRQGINPRFIWKKAVDTFGGGSAIRKLIGCGPETFGLFTRNFYNELLHVNGQYFDITQNEFIQFVLMIGAFISLVCLKSAMTGEESLYTRGMLWALICYFLQTIVNVNLSIDTDVEDCD